MNFLAHLYLSGNDKEIRFGNFMADGIRGKNLVRFSPKIQYGIELHRAIDTFTDQHKVFRKHCKLLSPSHGHYSRVIMDVVYDHFLASNWEEFHNQSLSDFAMQYYCEAKNKQDIFPDKIQRMISAMEKQNWLVQYQSISGLKNILYHMSKRTSFPSNFSIAVDTVENEREEMLPEFFIFFEEIKRYCDNNTQFNSP